MGLHPITYLIARLFTRLFVQNKKGNSHDASSLSFQIKSELIRES